MNPLYFAAVCDPTEMHLCLIESGCVKAVAYLNTDMTGLDNWWDVPRDLKLANLEEMRLAYPLGKCADTLEEALQIMGIVTKPKSWWVAIARWFR